MRFLALDPSSTVTGWAVFQDESLVAFGKIDTAKVEFSFRYQFIVNELSHLAQVYNFQEIAIEDTQFHWKGRDIATLRVAYMSIKKWAERVKLPITKYNVSTWKANVIGNSKASKEMVQANISLRYQEVPADISEHEADAIAVGVYHAGLKKLEGMAVK